MTVQIDADLRGIQSVASRIHTCPLLRLDRYPIRQPHTLADLGRIRNRNARVTCKRFQVDPLEPPGMPNSEEVDTYDDVPFGRIGPCVSEQPDQFCVHTHAPSVHLTIVPLLRKLGQKLEGPDWLRAEVPLSAAAHTEASEPPAA